jgi:D-alanyl-D-alanine carboxypeptidase
MRTRIPFVVNGPVPALGSAVACRYAVAMGHGRRFGVIAVAAALGLSGCVGAYSVPLVEAVEETASADPTPFVSCVEDVQDVIAREPAPASFGELPAESAAALDASALAAFAEAAAPGAIVGVRSPEGTWRAAYGTADPATGEPMAVGMHTRIGSVTKTFTGSVLLQLEHEGLLSLDDHVDEYVDHIPNGREITLRELATMTSGLASYTQGPLVLDEFFSDPSRVFTPEELVAAGAHDSPVADPGEQFDYSNTNTVLLGLVIEQVTGKPIGEVFAERVFEPLGLENTSWPGVSSALPEPYAHGFTLQQGDLPPVAEPIDATEWNPSWAFTAGELVSDLDDLLTYGRALGTGQGLVSEAGQTERLESFPGVAGYGIALGCVDGWVGHTGELPGYNTSVFYDTTTDTTVVVQVNSDIASGDCAASQTLEEDDRTLECSAPATRIFTALSKTLGHPFTPNPQS